MIQYARFVDSEANHCRLELDAIINNGSKVVCFENISAQLIYLNLDEVVKVRDWLNEWIKEIENVI